MSWLDLEEKVVVVTGGALGIGRATCREFAANGAFVVVGDVNELEGAKAVEELTKEFGGKHSFVPMNVTSKSSVDSAFQKVMEQYGRVDILVNNAGINIPRLLVDPSGNEELTEEIWDKTVTINMKGFFLCAQAAARAMMSNKKGGVIVNLSSESGLEGSEGQSVYAATKVAASSLARSWAKELGKHGIRVVALAPGILEATALRTLEYERALAYTRGITVEKLRESYAKVSIPLGRSGTLKEVADTIVFLASPRAGYIHGTTVNVSGGKSRG